MVEELRGRRGCNGRRNPNEAIYFREQIEDAAARFRQQVDASRTLVADLTPLDILTAHEGSRLLAELVNKPGRPPWDGATGSGLNWRLAYSELEAERRHLRLDGEPVILYSLVSPPARATANLLNDLYRLDSVMTVSLEWRPWDLDAARRKIRGAQRHYFSKAVLDDGPRAGDGRHGQRDGGQRGHHLSWSDVFP